jgi:hypothetical protein
MNWKQIFLLSLFGLGMGVASLLGLTKNIEPILWLLIALFCGYWFAKTISLKLFLHGLVAGIVIGILNSLCQSLFLDAYLASNPENAQYFQQAPINPRVFVLISGTIVGVIYGVIVGLLTLAMSKLMQKRVGQQHAA